jgi:hypothetical protein
MTRYGMSDAEGGAAKALRCGIIGRVRAALCGVAGGKIDHVLRPLVQVAPAFGTLRHATCPIAA